MFQFQLLPLGLGGYHYQMSLARGRYPRGGILQGHGSGGGGNAWDIAISPEQNYKHM